MDRAKSMIQAMFNNLLCREGATALTRVLTLSLLMVGLLCQWVQPVWADDTPNEPTIEITQLSVDKKTGAIHFQANQPLTAYQDYSSLKLMNPYRLVVDLPNTRLAQSVFARHKSTRIHHHGLKQLTLEETHGLFFHSVRMTVTTDNYDVLNRLTLNFNDKTGVMALAAPLNVPNTQTTPITVAEKNPSVMQPSQATSIPSSAAQPVRSSAPMSEAIMTTVPDHWAHITNVAYANQALRIQTDSDHPGQLRVKNRMVLTQPSRLVYDFAPAVLASKALQSTITVGDDTDTRKIRIGQFEQDTVRVVIETNKPEQFALTALHNNFKTAQLSRFTDSNQEQLASSVPLATLDKINLDMDNNVAKLRISADQSIVHRWHKEGDKLIIHLLNIAATPGRVAYDEKNFPFIQEMAVYPLTANQPNSQFVVQLDQLPWDISSSVANDGKTLELQMKLPVIGPIHKPHTAAPHVKKPARVVIDAGHGGKDQGASRAGVLEKTLNLNIALKLKRELEARGVKVYMTRWTDKYLPLKKITDITNGVKPDAFVSIHHNASTNPAIAGIETYYYTPQSKPFGQVVHTKMVSRLGRNHRGVRRAKFYVVHHTTVPAILCEIGYISNTTERNILKTSASQSKTAAAIADGVVEYLNRR